MRIAILCTVVLAVLPVCVGCTVKADSRGEPEATATTATTATTESPSTTASQSSRGRTVDLTSIDPCSLLTAQEQAQLNVVQPLGSRVRQPGITTCTFADAGGGITGFSIFTDVTRGIGTFRAADPGKTVAETTVDSFPGVIVTLAATTSSCSLVLDTSDGQNLSIVVTEDGVPADQLCARPQAVAPLVVSNLPN